MSLACATGRLIARALALVLLATGAAVAQEPGFQAKQVRVIIGFGPGGGYDQYGRLLARHIGKHLPGAPTVIAENMPSAGSLAAAATIYSRSPKDGSIIGIIARDAVSSQLLAGGEAKFDPLQVTWIGSAAPENGACVASARAPVAGLADLLHTQLTVGGTGAGAGNEVMPRVLNGVLGTHFKIISGYNGGADLFLAVDRGEIEGLCAAYSLSRLVKGEEIRSGKIKVLFQGGLSKDPSIPAPWIMDLVQDEGQRSSLRFLYGSDSMGWPFLAPPDLPPAIRTALRSGFDAAMRDPDLLRDAEKQGLTIQPTDGAGIEAIVRTIVATPRPIVEAVKASSGSP